MFDKRSSNREFQKRTLLVSFVRRPSATGRCYPVEAYPELRKSRIEDSYVRITGGSLLGDISWDILMGRRILSGQLFRGPGRVMAENLALFAMQGTVAPRHVSETSSKALFPIDCHQQGSMP